MVCGPFPGTLNTHGPLLRILSQKTGEDQKPSAKVFACGPPKMLHGLLGMLTWWLFLNTKLRTFQKQKNCLRTVINHKKNRNPVGHLKARFNYKHWWEYSLFVLLLLLTFKCSKKLKKLINEK